MAAGDLPARLPRRRRPAPPRTRRPRAVVLARRHPRGNCGRRPVRRAAMLVGAAVCLALAVSLSLLALDVHRRDASFKADDVLFRVGSLRDNRWQPTEIVPFGAARAVLGVDDDLAYRRALQLVRRAHPRNVTYEQSKLVELRAVAQIQLGAVVRQDDNAARRSAAANLLGVLALSLAAIDDSLRPTLLTNAAADFQRAVRFDPGSDDAKYNLELVLDTLVASGGGGRSGPRAAAPSTRVQERERTRGVGVLTWRSSSWRRSQAPLPSSGWSRLWRRSESSCERPRFVRGSASARLPGGRACPCSSRSFSSRSSSVSPRPSPSSRAGTCDKFGWAPRRSSWSTRPARCSPGQASARRHASRERRRVRLRSARRSATSASGSRR